MYLSTFTLQCSKYILGLASRVVAGSVSRGNNCSGALNKKVLNTLLTSGGAGACQPLDIQSTLNHGDFHVTSVQKVKGLELRYFVF